MNPRRGVILDRDGTLIDVVRDEETGTIHTAFHPDQLVFLPGVLQGLRRLSQAGYVLAIATNQPGVAKGQISRAAVERTHAALLTRLSQAGIVVSAVAVCLHHPHGAPHGDASLIRDCNCRKPKPQLLLDLIESLQLAREHSWMIGDSASDVEAARRANVRSALVFSTARCELCPLRSGPNLTPELCRPRFDELVDALLAY